MRLLPRNREVAWTPYVWLIFLGYIFLGVIFMSDGHYHVHAKNLIAAVVVTVVFLSLYFRSYWLTGTARLRMIAGIAVLGLAYMPFNSGADVFIVYAAALVPFAVDTRRAVIVIGVILAAAAAEHLVLNSLMFLIPLFYWMPSTVFAVAIGAVNIHFARTQRANQQLRMAHEEIERLARVAERERIARDLHDVLGHTLSVVVLKSELASRLIGQDPERAGSEISEVEQIAREALADVRQAIGGYRGAGLEEELTRAEATLRTAGVSVERRSERVDLAAVQETVLALAVREAVTNVVRHADARWCVLSLGRESGYCRLEIADDGCGGAQPEGNGVLGMRERVEALGGTLERDMSVGTRLTIRLPLTERE